jgi:arylsulfatase A-like enzyme
MHPIFGLGQGFDAYTVLGETIYDVEGFSVDRLLRDAEFQQEFDRLDEASHATRTSRQLGDRVCEAITRLAGAAPFFLFVHMFDVHFDYDPPEAYWRAFDPDYAGDFDGRDFSRNSAIRPDMPEAELRHLIARYDGEIRWTDEQVGRMLDALDEQGVGGNTVVAVIGDHGDEFFEHGDVGHRKTLFDEQLLVPFLLHMPRRLQAGRRVAMQVRMIDVKPTLLDLAVGDAGGGPGVSLVPYASGAVRETDLAALSVLATREELISSLRLGDAKLVVTRPAGLSDVSPRIELYDLEADPGERTPILRGPDLDAARREFDEVLRRENALRLRHASDEDRSLVLPESMRRALEELGYAE